LGGTTKDADSDIYVPASPAEYAALGLVQPLEIFELQESSGNCVGSTLGTVLTPNNTPLYQQAVTGWARKGIRGDGATGNQQFTGTLAANPGVDDVAVLCYIGNATPDGGVRGIMGIGTTPHDVGMTVYNDGATHYRYHNSPAGSANDTNENYDTGGHVLLLVQDNTNGVARWITELEARTPLYGLCSSGTVFGFGGIGGTFAQITIMYCAVFTGAAARSLRTNAGAKAFLEALGWTIPWS
jgi:hypothetical protein